MLYPIKLGMGGHDFTTWLPSSFSFHNSGMAWASSRPTRGFHYQISTAIIRTSGGGSTYCPAQ
jgi:hypothetical protein